MIKKLDSTNLKQIQYFRDSEQLKIWFHGGGVYLYSDVPEEIYDTLLNAKEDKKYEYSHGKCFHRLIRKFPKKYPYENLK